MFIGSNRCIFAMNKMVSLVIQFIFCIIRLEVCVPECHFPGTGIFPKNLWNFPPQHSGTSSSRSQHSTGIWDWLFPGLFEIGVQSWIPEHFKNENYYKGFLGKVGTFMSRVWLVSKCVDQGDIEMIWLYKSQMLPRLFPWFSLTTGPETSSLDIVLSFGKWPPVSSCLVSKKSSVTQTST